MSIVENHGVYVKEDNGDWQYKAGMMSTIHCAHHARFALSFSGDYSFCSFSMTASATCEVPTAVGSSGRGLRS